MSNKLETINFSKGIKEKEIQYNFDVIQKQIENERKSVGGPGISYGFDYNLNDFTLTFSNGSLIAKDGSQVDIDTTTINIPLPILIERKEQLLIVDEFNRIHLNELPYSINQRTTSDNVEVKDSGITVCLSENNDIQLSIANIDKQYITLNDYLYSGDTVLKILRKYTKDLADSAEESHNEVDMAHCDFLRQIMELL